MRGTRPAVRVALYNMHSAEQLEGLRQRSLDVALVCEPPAADDLDLACAKVLSDPMWLALPRGHKLAGAAALGPDDLNGQEWIAVLHKDSGLKHDHFIAARARARFTPDIRMQATEPLTALGLVGAGLGMALIQHSLRQHAPAGVVLRELPWFDYRTPLWAVWHRVNLRPLVAAFRATLLEGIALAPPPAMHWCGN